MRRHLSLLLLRLTLEYGADVFPDGDAAAVVELAQRQLHVEERHAAEHCHQQVGEQKGTWRRENNCSSPLGSHGAAAHKAEKNQSKQDGNKLDWARNTQWPPPPEEVQVIQHLSHRDEILSAGEVTGVKLDTLESLMERRMLQNHQPPPPSAPGPGVGPGDEDQELKTSHLDQELKTSHLLLQLLVLQLDQELKTRNPLHQLLVQHLDFFFKFFSFRRRRTLLIPQCTSKLKKRAAMQEDQELY